MPPKQRQIRMEQRGGIEAIQALEQRTDEELEAETKYKSAALAILARVPLSASTPTLRTERVSQGCCLNATVV